MLSLEEKVAFAFKVALQIAEEKNLLPLREKWRLEANLSESDLNTAAEAFWPLVQKYKHGEKVVYKDFENALLSYGLSSKTQTILAITYANSSDEVMDIIDEMTELPFGLKAMLSQLEKPVCFFDE
jgi:uncharacterized protein YprB with RNaseH-like and TPR domain